MSRRFGGVGIRRGTRSKNGAAAGGAFQTPDNLPNVTFWGRADDTVNANGRVDQVNDRLSGGTNHAVQSVSADKPWLNTAAGQASLTMDHSGGYTSWLRGGLLSNYISFGEYHVFAVITPTSIVKTSNSAYTALAGDRILGSYNLYFMGLCLSVHNGVDSVTLSQKGAGSVYKSVDSPIALNETSLIEAWYDGANMSIRVNDGAVVSGVGVDVLSNSYDFCLGVNSPVFHGDISECVTANLASVGDATIPDIRAYFANRYGVAV